MRQVLSPSAFAWLRRNYNRARRLWFAWLFIPVFTVVSIVDLVRRITYRLRRHRAREQRCVPPFHRPEGMPDAARQRSVADVVSALERIPSRPLRWPPHIAFFHEHGPDGVGMLLSSRHGLSALPHLYPGVFEPLLFTGDGGEQIAGLRAMHDNPGPALVICHGLLTSKNFDYIRRLAIRAYGSWGFHVAVIDLRGFGQTSWTSAARSSAGYFEGRDVVEVARSLHRDPRVTSVGTIGFSLGGATVLNAAHASSLADDNPIDGGVLAVSAPTDMRAATAYVSTRPRWTHPFFGLYMVFHAALRQSMRAKGVDDGAGDWVSVTRDFAAPSYGVTEEEFYSRASAVNWAQEITIPLLAIHAKDDFVVKVENAYALREVTAGQDNVHVWITERGNHGSYSTVDGRWYHSVVRQWFEYWAIEVPAD